MAPSACSAGTGCCAGEKLTARRRKLARAKADPKAVPDRRSPRISIRPPVGVLERMRHLPSLVVLSQLRQMRHLNPGYCSLLRHACRFCCLLVSRRNTIRHIKTFDTSPHRRRVMLSEKVFLARHRSRPRPACAMPRRIGSHALPHTLATPLCHYGCSIFQGDKPRRSARFHSRSCGGASLLQPPEPVFGDARQHCCCRCTDSLGRNARQ